MSELSEGQFVEIARGCERCSASVGRPIVCVLTGGHDAEKSGLDRWLAVQEQAHELARQYPDWRWGQALFNALHALDPVLANEIRGTAADPFNDAIRCPEFMGAVMRGTVTSTGSETGR